jgi:MFS-type transporter involved in bile tolerance (Atg22 family)
MNFFSQLSAIAAPILTGYIVQATHSFAGAFVAAAVFLIIGIAGYALLLRSMQPIPNPS